MANQTDKNVNKPNFFVRMGRKLKETFSELKKVTWPSFPKVVRGTCVVIVVVAAFLVVATGINYGLQALLNLITGIGE
ncbi:MAG: preprotein translocase subunit SecE [Clostridia bacterium]|nr:preprotein translocase subunit SecE [Clostridia bacterium]